jgi:signal transduction histidine kinase
MDTLAVLVVDDEPGMRLGVQRALRDFTVSLPEVDGEVAIEVDMAETGEEGLEKIRSDEPNILLLDHKLPGMSGLDVLDALVEKPPEDMLTVMITAYASIETAVKATKQGAYDFLPKPFTPGELRETVAKAARHLIMTRQARKLAEERRQVRFQFISVLAHELKSPINAVEGYLRILRDGTAGDNPEVVQEMLGRCLTRTEYMRKMITDLLDLTRIESGRKRREVTEVDVREVAEVALDSVRPQAEEKGVDLGLEAPETAPLQADRGEVEIIMNNLCSNAVKYNRENGRVDVRVERKDGAVKVEVADTGIGMSQEEAARLFQDFVRIKNEKTQGILGSGLGLSIVKKLASLYEGDIEVESEPDVGSTFRVELRDAKPEEAPQTEAAHA